MKKFTKITLGALLAAGATLGATAAAQAQVSFGIGIGAPGYYGSPAYSYSCDPYSRWYDPYRCDTYAPRYYGQSYYGSPSIYFGRNFVGGFRDRDDFRGGWGGGDRDGGRRGGDRDGGRGGGEGRGRR
jgi:hypothetical protein